MKRIIVFSACAILGANLAAAAEPWRPNWQQSPTQKQVRQPGHQGRVMPASAMQTRQQATAPRQATHVRPAGGPPRNVALRLAQDAANPPLAQPPFEDLGDFNQPELAPPPAAPGASSPRTPPREMPGAPSTPRSVQPAPRQAAPPMQRSTPPANGNYYPTPQPQPEYVEEYVGGDGYDGSEFIDDGGCGNGCSSGCPGYCGYYERNCPCGPCPTIPPGTWVTLDYLMWWSRGASLPPLVTTGSTTGAMTDPNVRILFGNERVDTDLRSGGRINVGTWLNSCRTLGVGGSFVGLQNASTDFTASSDGNPLLARPFFNTLINADDSQIVAQTGISSGTVTAQTSSKFLAAEAYFRHAAKCRPCDRLDLIYGYRYMQVSDSLVVNDFLAATDNIFQGTTIAGRDSFSAMNQFNGFELGFINERRWGLWSWNSQARISFGNMHQVVQINGDTLITLPGAAPTTLEGSLLTQTSNIGRHSRNVFAVVPEVNLNLGYQITPRLKTTFGYTFIYLNHVAQAARQIDNRIDPAQLDDQPGTEPAFQFRQNGFWLQGLNFGLDYRF